MLKCYQCGAEFPHLTDFLIHYQTHTSKERMFNAVKSVLDYFWPNVCPHCERPFDKPSDADIMKFLEGE